jgi:1-acyl-sn-glycerol-3-phosphate acyltransferase
MITAKTMAHIFIIAVMNFLSKFVLGIIVPFKLNVRYKNIKEVYSTRGPFVFLPNHTNQWDPFILCLPILRPIRWVASDAAFRNAAGVLLTMGGTISKVKEQSDMIAIQELKKAVSLRYVAGIFPEGTQTWDGETVAAIPATAKLVRFLKVPVIVPLFKGGYLTKPRWAWKARRCRIEVYYKKIIDADEIKTLKLQEIEQRIDDALKYDEYEWQKERMAPIRSNRRAEHLELAHFTCPSCEVIGELASEGNLLFCSCGYVVEVDRYGFFVYPEEGKSFEKPADWMRWQNRLLVDRIRAALNAAGSGGNSDPVLMRDAEVTLMKGDRAMPMKAVLRGEARLYRNRIEIGDPGGRILTIPLRETTAAATFKQQKFEFRYEKAQYRFAFPSRSVSGLKWELAYKGLREIQVERGEW